MCLAPVTLKKDSVRQYVLDVSPVQTVPCGKCLECMKLRANSWFIRLDNEMSVSSSACFVTLTYDDEHLPYTDDGNMTLDFKDTQKFFKRLRKRHFKNSKAKIKYFLVGEYGSISNRPHYHAIIFSAYSTDDILDSWNLGHVHIGSVSPASIYYTLKYCMKKSLQHNTDYRKFGIWFITFLNCLLLNLSKFSNNRVLNSFL